MDIKSLKLLQSLDECHKHIKRVLYAYHKMSVLMPLDALKYEQLTDKQVENIDQFIFRFSKLQDAMGERVFKSVLICLEENVKKKPFIDLLNRLEQLGALQSKEEWLSLRRLRNTFSHEYFDDSDVNALNINMVYTHTRQLYDIFIHIKKYINDEILILNKREGFILETPIFDK
ncbi:MAG: hypothetical protein KAH77_00350 [Thiomargarita sp.]|nr:hypothetical protein [Thiomargarita sp.]